MAEVLDRAVDVSRKKTEKDVVASFFGDDLDWLDDEDDGQSPKAPVDETPSLPVARPPEAAKGVSLEKVEDALEVLPGTEQPTIVYSDVPTLMPDEARLSSEDVQDSDTGSAEEREERPAGEKLSWFGDEHIKGDEEEASMFSDEGVGRGGATSGEFKVEPRHLDTVDVSDADAGPEAGVGAEDLNLASGIKSPPSDLPVFVVGEVHESVSADDAWRALLLDLQTEAAEVAESAALKRAAVQVAWSRFGSSEELEAAIRTVGGASTSNTERIAAVHFGLGGQQEQRDAALQRSAALGGESEDAAEATYLMACGMLDRGRTREACDALRTVEGSDAGFGEARLQLLRAASGGQPIAEDTYAQIEADVEGLWSAHLAAKRAALGVGAQGLDSWARVCEQSSTHGHAWNAVWSQKRGEGPGVEAAWCESIAGTASAPAWWWRRAANLYAEAGQAVEGERCAKEAVALTGVLVDDQRAASLLEAGELKDFVSCVEEGAGPAGLSPSERYFVGRIRERDLEDVEGALKDYQAVVEADPGAWPAHASICRLWGRKGASKEEAEALEAWRAQGVPGARFVRISLRLGELYEVLGDGEAAGARFEEALDAAETPSEVLEDCVSRSLRALGKWDALARHYASSFRPDATAQERAQRLYQAATVAPMDQGLREGALKYAQQALGMDPGHDPSLNLAVALWSEDGAWNEAAEALAAAAVSHSRSTRQGLFAYRAAQIYADHIGDEHAARQALEIAMGRLQGEPAVAALADRLGMTETPASESWASELGSGSAWVSLEVALDTGGREDTARRLATMMEAHGGGFEGLGRIHNWFSLDSTDPAARVERLRSRLQNEPSAAAANAVLAEAYEAHLNGGSETVFALLGDMVECQVDGWPVRAAAWLAEAAGDLRLAMLLWEKHANPAAAIEVVRLLSEGGRVDEALSRLGALREAIGDSSLWGLHLELCSSVGRPVEPQVWNGLAEAFKGEDLSSGGYRLAAEAYAAAGDGEKALQAWANAWEKKKARRYGRGWMDQAGKQGASWSLEGSAEVFPALEWAVARSRFPGPKAAAALLARAPEVPPVVALLCQERFLAEQEDWQGVLETLEELQKTLATTESRARAASRVRWVLAEKMAGTDAAWEHYQRLLERAPSDPNVLDVLARMAGVRGELDLASAYLETLAGVAATPEDVARVHIRKGSVWADNARWEEAAKAYLAALEEVAEGRDALAGLEAVYEAQERWEELRATCARRAAVEEGEERSRALRKAATLAKKGGGGLGVEIASWKALLAFEPMDEEALSSLFAAADAGGDDETLLTYGAVLVERLEGEEKARCHLRVGQAAEAQGKEGPAAEHYRAANRFGGPYAEALEALERIARSAGDWEGVVTALVGRSGFEDGSEQKTLHLHEAARVQVEQGQDPGAAEALYQKVLDVDPDDGTALRFVVRRAYEDGRHEVALDACRRLAPQAGSGLDLEDFDDRMSLADFYYKYAHLLEQSGEGTEAIESLEKALEFNPSHRSSLSLQGQLYEAGERWGDAAGVYKKLLQLVGGHGDPKEMASHYIALGRVEWAQGSADKSYARFNRALEMTPNAVPALQGLAMVLEGRQEWSSLLNIYNNIIYHATQPQDVIHAYMTKGRILDEELGRIDKAKQHYQRSLDFEGDQPVAYVKLAELALREGDYATSERLSESGLRLTEGGTSPAREALGVLRAASRALGGDLDAGIEAMADMGPLPEGVDGPDLAVASSVSNWVRSHLPR